MKKYTYILMTMLALAVMPLSAALAEDKLMPLPEIQSLDINTFVSQANEIEKTYEKDGDIGFKVQIPNSFVERSEDKLKTYLKDGYLYGDIYRADGPMVQDVYPYFQVKSVELQREISAKNWLISNILANGDTLRAIESDEKGHEFEALYVRLDRLGNTEVVRAKGKLHGARLMLAEYVVPIMVWESQKDYQTYAIKSFELLNNDPSGTVEPRHSFSFLDSFSMVYPASWRIKREDTDIENQIDLVFESAEETNIIFANIEITLIADQSLKDKLDRSRYPVDMPLLVKEKKQKISNMGFLIDPVIEQKNYDLTFGHQLQITEAYPLHRKITDYVTHRKSPVTHEFWITAIKGDPDVGKNYIVSMIAPARNESMYEWALAAKAYEIMIESLR